MNNFWRHLKLSLSERFNIDVDIHVFKNTKLVHTSLVKPLLSYHNFDKIID